VFSADGQIVRTFLCSEIPFRDLGLFFGAAHQFHALIVVVLSLSRTKGPFFDSLRRGEKRLAQVAQLPGARKRKQSARANARNLLCSFRSADLRAFKSIILR